MQSSRAQQLSRVPWKEIEKKIDARTKSQERASQGRIVKELLQERQRADNRKLVEQAHHGPQAAQVSPGRPHARSGRGGLPGATVA